MSSLTDKQKVDAMRAFNTLDKDRDGTISTDEVRFQKNLIN
jgi:Ca2+-binding EF-hand superfamily protein